MIIAKSMKLDVKSRILTERDLLDWIAQTLPIGKSLFKTRNRSQPTPDEAQGITNDSLDMKFGRELHTLYVRPNKQLAKRFPAIDEHFLYIPKPVSVGQTDVSNLELVRNHIVIRAIILFLTKHTKFLSLQPSLPLSAAIHYKVRPASYSGL